MKTRASTIIAFGVALTLATLTMDSAFADGTQKFKIRFAGGFVRNIQQEEFVPPPFDPANPPVPRVENRDIALIKGRGTFGRVDIMAVTASGPPSGQTCESGLYAIASIFENNLVLTFGDLSLLYGNGSGIVCPNVDDPEGAPVAEIEGTWDGGTGRFRHAGGEWSIRFDFARPVGVATQFVAETGVIRGHITRPYNGKRDDD